jgi:hypothetical protein
MRTGSLTLLAFVGALLGAPRVRAEQPPPAVVYLNFSNGTEAVTQGAADDATNNVSSLCGTERVGAYWGSSECGDRAECADIITELVADHFRDFNVVFTLERPKSGPYTMAIIGPPSGSCGFGVQGASPLDCKNQNPGNVVFAFNCPESVAACSVTISQELAHSYGLAHTVQTCDIMTAGSHLCAEPHFSDTDALADDKLCGAIQNNRGRLLEVLGPWTGGDSHRLPSDTGHEIERAPGCALGPAPTRGAAPLAAVVALSFAWSMRRRSIRPRIGEAPPKRRPSASETTIPLPRMTESSAEQHCSVQWERGPARISFGLRNF